MRIPQSLRSFLAALIIVGITLVLIELSLRLIDPWGLIYFDDVVKASGEMFVVDSQRGYGLRDGTFRYSRWQGRIEDGLRVVLETDTESDCTLAFLGDSVTFGGGVNDDQTWVNQVARELPGVHVRNYGVPRYNSTNVLYTRQAYPDHAAYIYAIFNNDSEPIYDPSQDTTLVTGLTQPWIIYYMQLALKRSTPAAPIDAERFFSDLDALLAEERVHLMAFADDVLTDLVVERGYSVHIVPYPPYPVSVADFHLNPQGSAELAASVVPFARDIAEQSC